MKVKVLTAFICVLFLARTVCAQNQYFLSQVANGRAGSQSFRTTFTLFNNSDVSATILVKLTDDYANPLPVTIPELGRSSEFTVTLDAGATRILQTDGSGNLAAGAATVTANTRIGVSAIFTVYSANGEFVTESGVSSSEPLSEFVIPVDATGLFNTGLALLNAGNGTASITLILLNSSGQETGRTALSLNKGGHLARFVTGPGQFFPSVANFRGTLQVRSSAPIAALTLRQNASPLSYTSLPVVPRSLPTLALNLPQVANGTFPGGSFHTSFLIFSISSSVANVELTLSKSDGTPFVVTIPGQGTAGTFNFTVPPGAFLFLQTDGAGVLAAGAATINSSVPIGACAIFSVFDSEGRFQTEAGVGGSPALTALTFPVDIGGNFDAGVAFFNPDSAATALTLRLLNANGFPVAAGAAITLQARKHTALFVSQIFPGTGTFRGSVAISASRGVAALALRQNGAPLSYTTLPVTSGTSEGKPVLLSRTKTGVSATTDVTVNDTLPSGFLLSGTIDGPGKASLVIAQAATGERFAGFVKPGTSRYAIAVAPGSYTLEACFNPGLVPSKGVTITHTEPDPVQVITDTNRNIMLASRNLFNVSGTISELRSLPYSPDSAVVFTSADGLSEGEFFLDFAGGYQGQLPVGSYTVSLSLPRIDFSGGQFETLSLFNLGSVNVSDAPVTANFSVPETARLSGNVQFVSPLSISRFVTASDTSTPRITDSLACVFPPEFSSVNVDGSRYELILARNRTYELDVTILLQQDAQGIDILVFPATPAMVTLGGNMSLDLNVPALPGRVTISGQVTDSSGRGIGNVAVTAFTRSLSGAPNVGFAAGAITDSNGKYRFTVLSGTNYQVLFAQSDPQPL